MEKVYIYFKSQTEENVFVFIFLAPFYYQLIKLLGFNWWVFMSECEIIKENTKDCYICIYPLYIDFFI